MIILPPTEDSYGTPMWHVTAKNKSNLANKSGLGIFTFVTSSPTAEEAIDRCKKGGPPGCEWRAVMIVKGEDA